jgi:hypothetical protein
MWMSQGRYGLRKLWQEYEFCLVVTVEVSTTIMWDKLGYFYLNMNWVIDLFSFVLAFCVETIV